MTSIGILGGGVAGLSLGYFIGDSSEVLEKESVCGGLSRSYMKDGFTYDIGGHIIFSKDQEILDFELDLLKGKLNRFFRKNTVWYKKRMVKYPFENGIGVLDKEDIYDCLYHFIYNHKRPQHNFEDWIYNTFGSGFANQYLIPYNTKIWKTKLSDMGIHWVERIPKPPAEDIIKSALGIETEGYTHQLYFYYPKIGGFETLPRTLESHIKHRVIRNFHIKKIWEENYGFVVSDGNEKRFYKKIICAMPLFDFICAFELTPDAVKDAASSLQYNSLYTVMIGLNRERTLDITSAYFPQEDLLFHRLVFFDYFGKQYVPAGCSSMVAEITARPDSALWGMSDEKVIKQVIAGLQQEGFLKSEEVITTDLRRIQYAYPIYDHDREKNLMIIHDWFEKKGISFCGRFAEFNYYNSDAVIRSAKTLANKLCH